MREILFKAKRVDNGEWVEGSLIANAGMPVIVDDICNASNDWLEFNNYSRVLPETVSQFTGLTDKNGVKIFENDIVKWGHIAGGIENPIRVANITFENGGYVYNSQFGKFYQGHFAYQNTTDKYVEIIGNIFDNPKLLESEVK